MTFLCLCFSIVFLSVAIRVNGARSYTHTTKSFDIFCVVYSNLGMAQAETIPNNSVVTSKNFRMHHQRRQIEAGQ